MPRIICHPDNIKAVAKLAQNFSFRENTFFAEFVVTADPRLEREQPSGKYILPGGEIVLPESICVTKPFITYGPEDIDWLLYAGIIKREMELLFFIVEDPPFAIRPDFAPSIRCHMPLIRSFA